MHARLRGSKAYLLFTKLHIKPDFPSLADEIAETHPNMNIKVAAFTVSEKSSNRTYFMSSRSNDMVSDTDVGQKLVVSKCFI